MTYDIRKRIPDLTGESGEMPCSRSQHDTTAVSDHAIASAVAKHKSHFFIEKDMNGEVIDYLAATTGKLKIVPDGDAKTALAKNYETMLADEVMVGDALTFEEMMAVCDNIKVMMNKKLRHSFRKIVVVHTEQFSQESIGIER